MRLIQFTIQFEKQRAVFCAGENIQGKVILHLLKPLKLTRIAVLFEGKGETFWDEHVGSSKLATKFRGRETYLNHEVLLYPDHPRDSAVEHPAGQYVYPFMVSTLPVMPASFESRNGFVRYTCQATIERPSKFDENISVKEAFTITRHMNLNQIPQSMVPVRAETEETVEGYFCKKGRVRVMLELNKTGFVPGEHLVYCITIQNNSRTTIHEEVSLRLTQITTYTGQLDSVFSAGKPRYHRTSFTIILLCENTQVEKNTTKSISRTSVVPSVPPSRMTGCNIINISYFLTLRVPCSRSTINLEKSILIGTIPTKSMPAARPEPKMLSVPGLEFISLGPDHTLEPPARTLPHSLSGDAAKTSTS